MNDSSFYHHLAIGVAFSPNLKANLAEAVRIAIAFNARLTLIHIGVETEGKQQDIIDALPDGLTDQLKWNLIFKNGKPVETILSVIREHKIDLILLGALKQEGFVKFYMGSIARKITKKASCSVLLMINPTIKETPRHHIVANGLNSEKTEKALHTAFQVAHCLKSGLITIVDEIEERLLQVKVEDSKTLRQSRILKQKMELREKRRVKNIVECVNPKFKENMKVMYQSIFGKRGYSIGHYAEVARADLLVMNAPLKSSLKDRFFPHDMEYILNELPTDVLIIR
ncbi:MAG: universal stress protein [Nonlabens sp.]